MMIAINTKYKKAWGGGSHFSYAITESLKLNNFTVTNKLSKHVDAILMVFFSKNTMTFEWSEALEFKKKNPNTILIQRINNLDTHSFQKKSISRFKKYSNKVDASVFVSDWARNYAHSIGMKLQNEYVVKNQVSSSFNNINSIWDKKSKLKIVTHHWSKNSHKGFNLYNKLGKIRNKKMKKILDLLYIGRSPFKLDGFKMKSPLHGNKLADKLSAQHMYFSASQLECGPYHVLEAMHCGLPVMYCSGGGAIKEYVGDCGWEISSNDMKSDIEKVIHDYDRVVCNVSKLYKSYDPKMLGVQYVNIIQSCRGRL